MLSIRKHNLCVFNNLDGGEDEWRKDKYLLSE
jgi:hypothetical protein